MLTASNFRHSPKHLRGIYLVISVANVARFGDITKKRLKKFNEIVIFMQKTMLERVNKLVERTGESKNSLANKCGMNPQTFWRYVTGDNKITVSLLHSLLDVFPDLSAEWLMRGDGAMYISDQPSTDHTDSDEVLDLKAEVTRLRAERDELRKIVEELKTETIELRAVNRYQERRLDKLVGIRHDEPQLSIVADKKTDYITNTDLEEDNK